jgi:NAD(P)-dependent dehydrogenase (short-subunit alcohol dehydrogenase family)
MINSKKVALVTGAANGIGKAIAIKLVDDGYFVVAVDTDDSSGNQLQSDMGIDHLIFKKVDICKSDQVEELFIQVQRDYGHVDALVNNAGIIRDNMIWRMSEDDFDLVINVNLKGTWLMCRQAALFMKEQTFGRIVNIASRAWLGNRGQSNYSASKAGVVALTRVLALELGKYNVLVNAIAPGLIDTPLTQKLPADVLQKLIEAQPTKTMGKPGDIAETVAFLLADNTGFITGQTLYVDGGKSIGANM